MSSAVNSSPPPAASAPPADDPAAAPSGLADHVGGAAGAVRIEGLAAALPLCALAFASGLASPPAMDVAGWAAAERRVSAESGSPWPGRWSNDRMPHLVEIMDCLSFAHPCRKVVLKKSARIGGTETGLNLFGAVVDRDPCPVLIVLPTLDEAAKYNRVKLQPAIDATPSLRAKVSETKSRSDEGSTAGFKRFPGGYCVLTGANSSAGLQMIGARVLIFEEVSEFPTEAGERGEPIALARKRALDWTDIGIKELHNSTPGLKLAGDDPRACRITKEYEQSDQRRRYVPCPQCGAWQTLEFANLKWNSDARPHGAYFLCASGAGCVIEPRHKPAMLARGVWIKTYRDADPDNPAPPACFPAQDLARWLAARGPQTPMGRFDAAGFDIWQAYASQVNWEATVAEYLEARQPGGDMKTFVQQTLGEAYEIKGDAPEHEKLFERREKYPPARLLPGILLHVLAVDVQGNRLEWAAYGFARDRSSWLVDRGVLEGDPSQPGEAANSVWRRLDELVARRYEDAWGRPRGFDAVGIDTGYLKNQVGLWARKYAGDDRTFPLDGRDGWKLPPLGTPAKQSIDFRGKRIGAFEVWPVGGFELKRELYQALRFWLEGQDLRTGAWLPGAAHFNETCDRAFFKQLTAEGLRPNDKGHLVWVRDRSTPNEQHDLAVYARALMHHLCDGLTPRQWDELEARRTGRPEDLQADFRELWNPAPAAASVPAPAAPEPPPASNGAAPAPRKLGGVSRALRQ
jgi:phage terminase large subunit GpA-like protein